MNEHMIRLAIRTEAAAERALSAADRIESAVHRLELLLSAGYGGEGFRLLELLEELQAKPKE